jgi:hypothetical protein
MIIRRSFPALVLMLLSTVWGFHSPNKATGYFGIHAPANTIFFSKNVNMIGEGSERSTNFGEGLDEFTMSTAESASAFDPTGVALFSLPVIKGTPKAVVKTKFVSGRIPAEKTGGAKFKPIPGDNAVEAGGSQFKRIPETNALEGLQNIAMITNSMTAPDLNVVKVAEIEQPIPASDPSSSVQIQPVFSLPVSSAKSVAKKAVVKRKSVAKRTAARAGEAKFKPIPGNSTTEAAGSQFKKIPETNALEGLQKIAAIKTSVLAPDSAAFAELGEIIEHPVPASDPSMVAKTLSVFLLPVSSAKSVAKKAVVKRKSVAKRTAAKRAGEAKFKPIPGNSTMEAAGSQFKKIPETNALEGLQKIAAITTSVPAPDTSAFAELDEIVETPVAASDPSLVAKTHLAFSLPVTTAKAVTKKAVVKRKSIAKRTAAKRAGEAKFKPIPGNSTMQAAGSNFKKIPETNALEGLQKIAAITTAPDPAAFAEFGEIIEIPVPASDPSMVAKTHLAFSLPVTTAKAVTQKAVVKRKSVAKRTAAKRAGEAKFKPIPGNNTMEATGSQFKKIPETNALEGLQKIAAITKSVPAPDTAAFAELDEIVETPVPASDPSLIAKTHSVFSLPVTTAKPVTVSLAKRKSVSRRMAAKKSGGTRFKPIPGNNTIEAAGSQFKKIPETNALEGLQKIAAITKSLQASGLNAIKVAYTEEPIPGSDPSPAVQIQSVFSLPATAAKSVTKSLAKRKSESRRMAAKKSGGTRFKPIPGNSTMEAAGSQFKKIPETNALEGLQKIAAITKSLQASDVNVDEVADDEPIPGSDPSPAVQIQSVFSLPATAAKSVTKSLAKRKSVAKRTAAKRGGEAKFKPIPGNNTMQAAGSNFKTIPETNALEGLQNIAATTRAGQSPDPTPGSQLGETILSDPSSAVPFSLPFVTAKPVTNVFAKPKSAAKPATTLGDGSKFKPIPETNSLEGMKEIATTFVSNPFLDNVQEPVAARKFTLDGLKDTPASSVGVSMSYLDSLPKTSGRKPVRKTVSKKSKSYLEGLKKAPAPRSIYFREELKATPVSKNVVPEPTVVAPSVEHTTPEESLPEPVPKPKESLPLLRKALILGVGAVLGLIWENTQDLLDDPPL